MSVTWFIAAEVVNLATCRPIDGFWHRSKPSTCINFNVMSLWIGTVETAVDLFILAIPIHMAFDLHVPIRSRIAVAGIFALGGFSIVTNIVRIKFMYIPGSRYGMKLLCVLLITQKLMKGLVNWSKSSLWLHIHAVTGMICGYLPIYKMLLISVAETSRKLLGSVRSHLVISCNRGFGDSPYILEEGDQRPQSL